MVGKTFQFKHQQPPAQATGYGDNLKKGE